MIMKCIYLREEIARLEAELFKTDTAAANATGDELVRLLDIAAYLRRELARLRKELASIEPGSAPPP